MRLWSVTQLDDGDSEKMEDVLDLYERPYGPREPVVVLQPGRVLAHYQ